MIINSHDNKSTNGHQTRKKPDWYYGTTKFAKPNLSKAVFQLFNTFVPYAALWVIIVFTVVNNYPYWITFPLLLIAAALQVRIFVIFHDCVHNSFFDSHTANRICGCVCGILACTPYDEWQWTHARHHASVADLDNRGYGSVWTLTVEEYLSAKWLLRLRYRLFRNPLILFGIAPWVLFLFLNRFPSKGVRVQQRRSVIITNVCLLIILLAATFFLGFWNFFKIAAPVIIISSTIGVWLFYIQHQFEGVYWARHDQWDVMTAAMRGSSYYKLPNILHWFTANIGIHHVHHLRTAIPNYNLQQCYNETPQLQDVNAITIRQSLRSLRLNLWDENAQKLISFRDINRTE